VQGAGCRLRDRRLCNLGCAEWDDGRVNVDFFPGGVAVLIVVTGLG
jgi:hypothetical protein